LPIVKVESLVKCVVCRRLSVKHVLFLNGRFHLKIY